MPASRFIHATLVATFVLRIGQPTWRIDYVSFSIDIVPGQILGKLFSFELEVVDDTKRYRYIDIR